MNRPEPKDKLTAHAVLQSHAGEEAPRVRLTHAQIRTIYLGLVLTMFLAAMNQTIVATALPSIGRHFGDVENLAWVVTAFLLTATVVSPLYGKLSDIYGRRAVMLAAIGIFMAGSVAAALAPNMTLLILGRGVQGLGGGGLVALVQATVADIVTPRERGRYQAYMSSVWICAGILGPVMGGFLAEAVHWSAIFWINVPLGILAALLTHKQLRLLPRNDRYHKLDFLGAGLMMASAVSVLLALTWGGTWYPWLSPEIIGLMALAGVLGLAFSWRLTHTDEPFLPLQVLGNPVMKWGTAANALAFGPHLALTVFVPIYFQLVHGLSPIEAGAALIPLVMLTTPGSVLAGRVMMHFNRYKRFAAGGLVIAILGNALLAWHPGMPFQAVMAVQAVAAIGLGVLFPMATIAVQNAVSRYQVGTATGAVNFSRQLMGALVIALFGAILLAGLGVSSSRGSGMAVLTAPNGMGTAPAEVFRWVFGAAALLMTGALICWLVMEERPLAGPDHPSGADTVA